MARRTLAVTSLRSARPKGVVVCRVARPGGHKAEGRGGRAGGANHAHRCAAGRAGRVHLGVVHLFDLERPDVHPREPEIADAAFRPLAAILADLENLETWSQICVRALFDADGARSARRAG